MTNMKLLKSSKIKVFRSGQRIIDGHVLFPKRNIEKLRVGRHAIKLLFEFLCQGNEEIRMCLVSR